MPGHQPLRRLSALALAGGAALALAGPASATPRVVDLPGTYVEHWNDTFDQVIPDGDPDFCGDLGFPVVDHAEASGTFVATVRGDGLWYHGDRFRGFETITNPVTGHVLRRDFNGTDRDQKVVDNGDGTLTIQVQQTGPDRYSLDGTRLFLDAGMVRFSVLVDDGGTPGDPSDDSDLGFLGYDAITGARQTDGRDFCADIAQFLG
jgi:hypothetical protein